MRFIYLPLLCLATSIFAAPVDKREITSRDARVIEKSIGSVQNALNALANAVRSLHSDTLNNAPSVIARGNDLTNTVLREAGIIRKGPNVDMGEAMMLIPKVEGLYQTALNGVNVWLSQKHKIIETKGQDAVIKLLRDNEQAHIEYTEAIVTKMPEIAKGAGRLSAMLVTTAIQGAINEFRASTF
ncbi:hypothetical protein EJ08DRAFT_182520 [Tothia fuscella]|uniref:DUF4142 domain-containing protein n=1 Tax=Tothia fuscella TaxID=1048955 RepID=A0A9P4NUW1_9PEZI|nr:hypothetical protein EJ08DRAFT_182520 [Tothia fuscella]